MKKIFIGAAWPYVNGDLHIGHLAGYLLPADIFSRFCRLCGYETLMVSGTDCHGTPITVEADKRGVKPEDIVNEYTPKIHYLLKLYNLTFDIFTSTTTINHKKITQEFFLRLLKNGYIFKAKELQYFSPEENKFLPDRYVEGKCSFCGAEEQRGDQCERCGRVLNPGELVNPLSKLTKKPVILKETEHYFLDYAKLQSLIEEYVKEQRHWRKWVYEESLSWLKEGLKPRAITRDIDWGIEIPEKEIPKEMKLESFEHKRFYVWFEAVIGYFSASVEWANKNNRDFREFWQDENCLHYYFMGKDNLSFHTLFWPGELLGQHMNLNLPYFPWINNFLFLEGQKFSKSRGVIIDSIEFGEKYGPDYVRFYLIYIFPENKDSDFKWKDFEEKINNELNDNLGNFLQRVFVFYKEKLREKIEAKEFDNEIIEKIKKTYEKIREIIFLGEETRSFNLILDLIREGNKYLEKNEPWKKENKLAEKVIFNSLLLISNLTYLLNPFLPNFSSEIRKRMSLEEINYEKVKDKYLLNLEEVGKIKITSLEPLFRKIKV